MTLDNKKRPDAPWQSQAPMAARQCGDNALIHSFLDSSPSYTLQQLGAHELTQVMHHVPDNFYQHPDITTGSLPKEIHRNAVTNRLSAGVGTRLTWQQQLQFNAAAAEVDAHASSGDTGEVTIKLRMLLVLSGEYTSSVVMVVVGGPLCTRINLELVASTRGEPIACSSG